MSEDWPEDAALAELQAVMFEVLARGGSAEEAARALHDPALAAWVRSADPRAWEVAALLVAKWGRREED
jgi:hypothetical protein